MEIVENRAQWEKSYRKFVAYYQRAGEMDWSLYPRPRNRKAPAGPGVDLATSRLILITTSGAYLPGAHEPFDASHPLGDYSIRQIPSTSRLEALAYAHEHYDLEAVSKDPQVLVPLVHLRDLVAEGVIGEMAPSVISFMGYQPDVSRVVDEMIPPILEVAQSEEVQAALLVPA
jgi:D-proline reductase (dithiol) PrdB